MKILRYYESANVCFAVVDCKCEGIGIFAWRPDGSCLLFMDVDLVNGKLFHLYTPCLSDCI